MFKRIDHVELLTLNPEVIIDFYTDVLGFSIRERMTIPKTSSGPLELAYLELGGTTIEVMCYTVLASIPRRNAELCLGWQCLALEVEDMETATQIFKEKGVEVVWGPVKISDYVRAEIRDPDGNPLEIRQWNC